MVIDNLGDSIKEKIDEYTKFVDRMKENIND